VAWDHAGIHGCYRGMGTSLMFIPIRKFSHMLTPNLYRVVDALKEYKYETRIVGGAVRDLLSGREPRDVDLATTALPDEIMYLLEKHQLKYTTRGIMHGTVKVIFSEQEEYEITTRDYRITDEKKTLNIEHDPDWIADAKRRDFTINALMMDLSGEVFDYVGGLDDLKARKIKMIGDPETKILHSPNLLVRFFKAVGYFSDPVIDKRTAQAVKENMTLMSQVDPGWTEKQVSTFRKYPNGPRAEKLFQEWSVAELTESQGEWRYMGCCVDFGSCGENGGDRLNNMIDQAREIGYRTFIGAVGIRTVASVFPQYTWRKPKRSWEDDDEVMDRDNRGGLTLRRDYHVRYYKSRYGDSPCYFIVHSAIEYIFVPMNSDEEVSP